MRHPETCPECWGTGYERGWGRPCRAVVVTGRDPSNLSFKVFDIHARLLASGPFGVGVPVSLGGTVEVMLVYDGSAMVWLGHAGRDFHFQNRFLSRGGFVTVRAPDMLC